MRAITIPPIPAGENAFKHDHFSMGVDLNHGEGLHQTGKRVLAMYGMCNLEGRPDYVIIVNEATGERIRIDLEEKG